DEMGAGQRAVVRKTAGETMCAMMGEEPEPVAKLRPDFPVAVRWILDRCLEKEPEERYASTRDLARDLAGLRDHISEASSGAEALLATPQRRRRFSPLLAGIALLALGLLARSALTRAFAGKAPSPPSFKRLTFRQGGIRNARFAPDGQTIFYGAHFFGDPGDSLLYSVRPESPESRVYEYKGGDIIAVSGSGELAILLEEGPTGGTLARVSMSGRVPPAIPAGI